MGVQSGINRLIGTISFGAAAVSRVAAGLKEAAAKTSAAAMEKAKKGYEKSASTKAQNKKIEKSYADLLNSTMPGVKDSNTKPEKVKQPEVLESSIKPAVYEKLLPQPKQKFILSEEGAEYPTIKADNSTTGIDAKDEDVATLIKVREKNQNRVMGGLHAWETRQKNVMLTSKKQAKTGLYNFKELEKTAKRTWEEFTPVTDEEAKQLGLNKQTLRNFAQNFENNEGAYLRELVDEVKAKYKDDQPALDYIQDYWDNILDKYDYYQGEENASIYNSTTQQEDTRDLFHTMAQNLLSGEYKKIYDPELRAKLEEEYLEKATAGPSEDNKAEQKLKEEYEASKVNKSESDQESEEVKSWQKLLANRQSKQTEIEEPEVKEDDKYSVWETDDRDFSRFVF